MTEQGYPKTGVGVMVLKGNQVLLGERKATHGAGTFQTPGGHLEYLESFEDCARREVREETGMDIKNIRFSYLANLVVFKPKQYTHIGLVAEWESGDPQNLEPEKCNGWNWYDLDSLPSPILLTNRLLLHSYKTGKNYYDIQDVEEFIKKS